MPASYRIKGIRALISANNATTNLTEERRYFLQALVRNDGASPSTNYRLQWFYSTCLTCPDWLACDLIGDDSVQGVGVNSNDSSWVNGNRAVWYPPNTAVGSGEGSKPYFLASRLVAYAAGDSVDVSSDSLFDESLPDESQNGCGVQSIVIVGAP